MSQPSNPTPTPKPSLPRTPHSASLTPQTPNPKPYTTTPPSQEEYVFYMIGVVFTSIFAIELLINLFARSADFFRPFFADYW